MPTPCSAPRRKKTFLSSRSSASLKKTLKRCRELARALEQPGVAAPRHRDRHRPERRCPAARLRGRRLARRRFGDRPLQPGDARGGAPRLRPRLRNRRYDVLLRFVPDAEREGLGSTELKRAWEGEERAELERLISAVESGAADGATRGDRATARPWPSAPAAPSSSCANGASGRSRIFEVSETQSRRRAQDQGNRASASRSISTARARARIKTPLPFLSHMLEQIARHGAFDLSIVAEGDVEIDGHHTTEDVGIVLGKAVLEALGDRQGIRRYGSATLPMDEALVTAALDLSGRPFFVFRVPLAEGQARQLGRRARGGVLRGVCAHGAGESAHRAASKARTSTTSSRSSFKAFRQGPARGRRARSARDGHPFHEGNSDGVIAMHAVVVDVGIGNSALGRQGARNGG